MDEDEIFEDCESNNTVLPLEELKEWIESYGKFPKNIRKLRMGLKNILKKLAFG